MMNGECPSCRPSLHWEHNVPLDNYQAENGEKRLWVQRSSDIFLWEVRRKTGGLLARGYETTLEGAEIAAEEKVTG
jgi:hypothetical protein